MYKSHFNGTTFIKARVVQSTEKRTTNLKVWGSGSTVGKKIISYFVAFDALLEGRLIPYY